MITPYDVFMYLVQKDEALEEMLVEMGRAVIRELLEHEEATRYKRELDAIESAAFATILDRMTCQSLLLILANKGEELVLHQLTDLHLTQIMAARWVLLGGKGEIPFFFCIRLY